MALRLGMRGWSLVVALLVAALIAWAWIDGGAEPLRTIVTPVTLPAPRS